MPPVLSSGWRLHYWGPPLQAAGRSPSTLAPLSPACGRPWSSGGGTFVTCGRAGLRQPPQPPADRAPPGPVAGADGGREVGAEQGAGRVARTGGRWALDAREGPRGGLVGNAVRAGRVRVLGGRQSG